MERTIKMKKCSDKKTTLLQQDIDNIFDEDKEDERMFR